MIRFFCFVCQKTRRARSAPSHNMCRRHDFTEGKTNRERMSRVRHGRPNIKRKKNQPKVQAAPKKSGKSLKSMDARRNTAA